MARKAARQKTERDYRESEPDGWEEINYPQLEAKLYQLDEVVSRKKQLLPLIISLLEAAPVTSP